RFSPLGRTARFPSHAPSRGLNATSQTPSSRLASPSPSSSFAGCPAAPSVINSTSHRRVHRKQVPMRHDKVSGSSARRGLVLGTCSPQLIPPTIEPLCINTFPAGELLY